VCVCVWVPITRRLDLLHCSGAGHTCPVLLCYNIRWRRVIRVIVLYYYELCDWRQYYDCSSLWCCTIFYARRLRAYVTRDESFFLVFIILSIVVVVIIFGRPSTQATHAVLMSRVCVTEFFVRECIIVCTYTARHNELSTTIAVYCVSNAVYVVVVVVVVSMFRPYAIPIYLYLKRVGFTFYFVVFFFSEKKNTFYNKYILKILFIIFIHISI